MVGALHLALRESYESYHQNYQKGRVCDQVYTVLYFFAILLPRCNYLQEGQVSNSFLAAQMPQTICPSLFDTHHEKNHKIILNTVMNGKVKY